MFDDWSFDDMMTWWLDDGDLTLDRAW